MPGPFTSPVAQSVPFEPDRDPQYGGNPGPSGITSEDVQSAIEEAKATAVAKVRFTIVTVHNGTITNNQWLGYSELLPGDLVGIRLPLACKLREISASFNNASVDGTIVLYQNGTLAGNIIDNTTFVLSNVTSGIIFTGIDYTFAANDVLRARWTDSGQNPSDLAIVYYFEVL